MRTEREVSELTDLIALRYTKLIDRYESLVKKSAMAWVNDSPDLDRLDAKTLMLAAQIRECELQLDMLRWFEGRKTRYRDTFNSYLDEKTLNLLTITD